jgi:hypothetical protein
LFQPIVTAHGLANSPSHVDTSRPLAIPGTRVRAGPAFHLAVVRRADSAPGLLSPAFSTSIRRSNCIDASSRTAIIGPNTERSWRGSVLVAPHTSAGRRLSPSSGFGLFGSGQAHPSRHIREAIRIPRRIVTTSRLVRMPCRSTRDLLAERTPQARPAAFKELRGRRRPW